MYLAWNYYVTSGTTTSNAQALGVSDIEIVAAGGGGGGGTPPTITEISPAFGLAGTIVTITGTDFTGATAVRLNGVAAASYIVDSATTITATAPTGVTSGTISVTTAGGTAASTSNFTVPALTIAISGGNSINEGDNSQTATVTATPAPTSDLTITLASSSATDLTVDGGSGAGASATATIFANATEASFFLDAPADNTVDNDASVNLTATAASGYKSATAIVTVRNVDFNPPTIVVNKYINATPDKAELLVVGNGTPGETVDMRGMIFKDFTGNMGGDSGAQYTFTTDALWAAVPVGTLIVLSNDSTAVDTDTVDFKLDVGLNNTTYFTKTGGNFDISTTEMVMIKVAGSGTAGVSGGIHALAAGTAGANYTDFVGHKLIATGTTGTDQGVYANNTLGQLTDFDGTDATGTVAKTDAALTFGAASTPGNATFIASLRGLDPTDGSGAVTLANSTVDSPYALSPIFARGESAQSVSLTLTGTLADKTISEVTVLVPALLGAPVAGNVSLEGTGANAATASVNGQTITVSGVAVTTTAPLTINISGLSTPALADLSSNLGNLPFTVSTAKAGVQFNGARCQSQRTGADTDPNDPRSGDERNAHAQR